MCRLRYAASAALRTLTPMKAQSRNLRWHQQCGRRKSSGMRSSACCCSGEDTSSSLFVRTHVRTWVYFGLSMSLGSSPRLARVRHGAARAAVGAVLACPCAALLACPCAALSWRCLPWFSDSRGSALPARSLTLAPRAGHRRTAGTRRRAHSDSVRIQCPHWYRTHMCSKTECESAGAAGHA
jgi:hypothetical protein